MASRMVTCEPTRFHTEPISKPITPEPMTPSLAGTSIRFNAPYVVQYVYIVDGNLRQRTRYGTGRHDDVFGFDNGFFAFVIDFDLVGIAVFSGKRSRTEQAGYFVFLEQEFHAAGELGYDGVFARNHFRRVKFDVADADAVFGEIMLRGVEMFAGLQQGFGRNAADVQAGAAQRGRIACFVDARIDTGGFETQLGGADGGNVSAGACADDYYIVLRHVKNPLFDIFAAGKPSARVHSLYFA